MYAQNSLNSSWESDSASQSLRALPQSIGKTSLSQTAGIQPLGESSHTVIGLTPSCAAGKPLQSDNTQFDPDKYLVGRILSAYALAKKRDCAVCLKHAGGSFTLFPGDRKILVWMPEEYMCSLAASPMDDDSLLVTELKIGAHSGLDPLDPQHDLDVLLWKLSLLACRGRFPVGTDPHAPVVLKSWPEPARLREIPYAARMADMWHRSPHSLVATANVLDIPQRYVFSFYSAAYLMGLADTVPCKSSRGHGRPMIGRGSSSGNQRLV